MKNYLRLSRRRHSWPRFASECVAFIIRLVGKAGWPRTTNSRWDFGPYTGDGIR